MLFKAEESTDGGFWASAFPILPHPGELIVGTICFSVIVWLMYKKVVPRLEEIYAQRTAAIQGGIEEAASAQKQAAAALAEYTQQLADARTEASKIREDARAEGAAILAELKAQAAAESARITSSAKAQIAAERQQAVQSLRTELGSLATDLASKLVGESLADEARQRRTVERFLAELEATTAVTSGPGS